MKVSFHATIREKAGVSDIEIDAGTIEELVQSLRERLGDQLYDAIVRDGILRDDIVILVNGRNIAQLQGLETRLNSSDEIAVFPPISGG